MIPGTLQILSPDEKLVAVMILANNPIIINN